MPGFGDTTFIVLLALLLFGPKKLPVLARQLGKLMADFRRASNEFRTQMEEELRISEQAERQKQVEAIEAAAPRPTEAIPEPEHPHLPAPISPEGTPAAAPETAPAPVPISTSGSLNLMPPSTGLPVANTIHTPAREPVTPAGEHVPLPAAESNGAHPEEVPEHATAEGRPWMI